MAKTTILALKSALLIFTLSACGVSDSPQTTTTNSSDNNDETSNFSLVANGEDFIRQGFVSKDGWQIDFNHAYVTLNQVTAYQTNPPFNAEEGEFEAVESVALVETPTTIDLAEGDENASPIVVTEVSAPEGNYNAIGWSLVNDPEKNASVILDGVAVKDDRTVDFVISFPIELEYLCGEFVGDERKGIIEANQPAELETTFHFDHLFGDSETPADDELNLGALGFEPLAVIASNDNQLQTDLPTLEQQLSSEDYSKLMDNLKSLGHVGEGHCRLENQ